MLEMLELSSSLPPSSLKTVFLVTVAFISPQIGFMLHLQRHTVPKKGQTDIYHSSVFHCGSAPQLIQDKSIRYFKALQNSNESQSLSLVVHVLAEHNRNGVVWTGIAVTQHVFLMPFKHK